MPDLPPYKGMEICHNCGQPLDWKPKVIHPQHWYCCVPCETKLLRTGAMIRIEEFVDEWPIFQAVVG